MALRGLAGVGLLVDRHQAHEPHQTADAFLVHGIAFVLQMPCHLADAVERGFQKLLVDQQHEIEVRGRLTLRRVVERRPRDRQQAALRAD